MSKKDQHQEPEAFPTSTAGNGSRSPSREEEQDARSRTKRAAARKATGPRTTQGKNRSRLNAIKHGLYFKAVLLEGESEADYLSLLGGLQDYYWPEGQMESAEVENVAVLLWRKRRFFQAENAVISENAIFTGIDAKAKRNVEAWQRSRAAIASGGLLMPCNNPLVVREAIETLNLLRLMVTTNKLTEISRILKKLSGEVQDGEILYGPRLVTELYAMSAKLAEEQGNQIGEPERREYIVAMIDFQIEPLKIMEKILETLDRKRIHYKTSAAVIPGPEVSDRLMRLETHLDRLIDRSLNRLERLQRMRKGQSPPPLVDLRVS